MQDPVVLRSGENTGVRGGSSLVGRPRRAIRATAALLLLLPPLTGCYTYVPVASSAVPPGTEVTMAVTDRGRVALTDAIGPGVRRIGGSVMSSTDSSVVLAVRSVQHIDLGVPVRWDGERVEVSRDFVSEIREKRLSRTRTGFMIGLALLGAVGASAIVIDGFGSDPDGTKPDDGEQPQTIRIPLFIR